MNFLTMQQELSDRVGSYDETDSSDSTKIKRWLNLAVQDVCSRQNWQFLEYHEIIQGVPDITTGTVTISTNSTALTFSSAPSVSVTDYFIQFADTDNWYRISSHTASSTSATLSNAFGGSSNITAGAYTLRKLWYATSTPLDSIIYIKDTVNGKELTDLSPLVSDLLYPLYYDQGTPNGFIASIPNSSGGIRISFVDSPSEKTNFQVKGIAKLSDMSSDSDTSLIPTRWHSTVLDMAAFYAFSSVGDPRATNFYNKAEKGIQSMAETFSYSLGRHRVVRSLEDNLQTGPAYSLPPEY